MLPKSIIQHIHKLSQKKYRQEYAEFVVEGMKGVSEALTSSCEVLLLVIEGARRDNAEFAALVAQAEEQDIEVVFAGRTEIDTIKATETFPGCLAVVSQPIVEIDDILEAGGPIICLDQINDPGNLGTIIRTADWFGIKHILLSEGSVDPYNEKVVRSTMGSIFRMNMVKVDHLEEVLETFWKNGYQGASFQMDGQPCSAMPKGGNTIYLFGSESHGVRPEIAAGTTAYTIPSRGSAESLNVAIAAGIIMSQI